jgi:hypothetical protein
MTFKQPPAVASWCLVHLSDPDEGLLGDLIEEYQRRQSPIWYWRQIAIAIVVNCARRIWTHKLETMQAVFTALAALGVAARVVIEPAMLVLGTLAGRGWTLPPGSWTDPYMWITVVLWLVAAALTGTLIARLHAERRATMTIAVLLFMAAWNLPEWYRMAADALTLGPRFVPYLVNSLIYYAIVSSGIFVGSLWARDGASRTRHA